MRHGGLLPLLRIARRDAMRAKGRSALIVVMIALPVFAMTFADVLGRTAEPDPDEKISRTLGTAQYVLAAEAPIGSGYVQAPDPMEGSASGAVAPRGEPRFADLDALVPQGARALSAASGTVQVETRAGTGYVGWHEVAAADPAFAGRFEVLEGTAPRDDSEVLATPELLERTGVAVGGRLTVNEPDADVTVVGTARQEGVRGEEAVYALPGALVGAPDGIDPAQTRRSLYVTNAPPLAWDDVVALNEQGVSAYERAVVADPPPRERVPFYMQTGVEDGGAGVDLLTILAGALLLALAGLEVVLLAGAAFAVGARRQAHSLALLAATGGTARHVRLVVLAGGLVLGAVAAVAGVTAGILAAALARAPLESLADADFARFDVRPLELLAVACVALVTGVLAAVVPSRAAARQDVVAALGGRRGSVGGGTRRVPAFGVAIVLAGVGAATAGSLWTAANAADLSSSEGYLVAGLIAVGAALSVLGLVVLSPAIMGLVGRLGARLPLAPRLVVRDASRHRGRSAPAMAAVLAAVSGSAALLLVVAAMDDSDRRAYQPQLAHQTAAVSLLEYGAGEEKPTLRDPAPVVRAVAPHLPVRDSVVVTQLEECYSASCRSATLAVPPANRCPGSAGGDEATGDWRCSVATDGWNYGSAVASGGFVVGDAALLERLYGVDDAGAGAALEAGGVVAFDRALVRDGRAAVEVFELYDDPTATPPVIGDSRRVDRVRLPAAIAERPRGATGAFLSPAAAAKLGIEAIPAAIAFQLERLPTQDEEDAAAAALESAGMENVYLAVERGYVSDYALGLLALVLAAAVITLGAAGVATGLAQADARADHATLAAVGANPRLRRRLSALQALLIAGLGSALGIAVGFVPAVALIGAIASLELVLPWAPLLAVLVGLPLLAAAAAWLCTRARLPLERRLQA